MNDAEKHKNIADGMECCERQTPKFLSMSQNVKIDYAVRNIRKMKFTKNSSLVKCLVHVVNEDVGSESTIDDEIKKEIDNEIEIIMSMKDN